jgi:hypothetical protein
MTLAEIMQFLKDHENPNGKKVLTRHGAREPFYGVRIGGTKKVVKKVKKNHEFREWMGSDEEMIACKVPFAPQYIDKVIERGNLGKKRKNARC